MIEQYNSQMGGVDLLDQMVAAYRVRVRERKLWWAIYAWSFSVSAVNAWRLMCHVNKRKTPYLDFLCQTVMQILKVHGLKPGPALFLRGAGGVSVRQDGKDHWIVSTEGQQPKCKVCFGRSSFRCEKCQVGLHPKCFKIYHVTAPASSE